MRRLRTPLCDLFGIDHPIVQAGMGGGAASPDLAREVSRAGGLGTMSASFITADDVRKGIQTIRAGTDRPFAVNLLMCPELLSPPAPDPELSKKIQAAIDPLRATIGLPPKADVPAALAPFVQENLKVIFDEKPAVLSIGLGNPGREVVEECHKRGIKVTVMVTSVKDAKAAAAAGVDAIVVQGWEAGGHRSHFADAASAQTGGVGTLALIAETVDAVKVPVIAAGGITDGRGLVAALAMGASGVQLGTRFVATKESGSAPGYKQALLDKTGDDTVVTDLASGWFARALKNELVEHMAASGAGSLPFPLQLRLQRDLLDWARAHPDDSRFLHMWAGQGLGLIHDLPGAGEVVSRLVTEALDVLEKRLPALVKSA